MITLSTHARDNHGHTYLVTIEPCRFSGKPTLVINGAPSRWWLESLADMRSERIAIDLGQNWFCTNIQDLLREIRDAKVN